MDHDIDLYPYRTKCRACGSSFRYLVLDRTYCSYECAGATVPDASVHPASCWTWDDKPKMGFPTQSAAERMCLIMHVPGTGSYYCPLHHFWHVGFPEAITEKMRNV